MGGGEFARGRQAQGASTFTWAGWGVSAVMVHQGHARSASHWQARSTDLKLSQTPPRCGRCGGQWAVGSLCAVGWLPGDRRPPLWRWPEFRLGHPAEIGDWRAGGQDRQAGRRGRGPPVGNATVCRCRLGCRCRTRCSAQRTAERFQGAGARPVREQAISLGVQTGTVAVPPAARQ